VTAGTGPTENGLEPTGATPAVVDGAVAAPAAAVVELGPDALVEDPHAPSASAHMTSTTRRPGIRTVNLVGQPDLVSDGISPAWRNAAPRDNPRSAYIGGSREMSVVDR
jgi:hypothetical protein